MRPFVRPAEPFLTVERTPVDGTCPECGRDELARYPVLTEGGWWDVTKCQACLARVEARRGNRLGTLTLLTDDL
jgi:vanillate/4-hydroxybenzoate decarboxylase subunit D